MTAMTADMTDFAHTADANHITRQKALTAGPAKWKYPLVAR